ncbi:methyl-accepting chemotaxis protein [uncultured Roseobacter sp.]|uniref:methyl-accepting chemotaxis protein n=1 Tax=uncultured Roseobacter sp. TaxID=114847 RepID=UPI00263501AA|nr:methyl-accepting chemotaxis protein [uncultured Roseobacter sp.]
MKLKKKLTLMIAGLVALSLGVLSLVAIVSQKNSTEEMIVAQLADRRDAALDGFNAYLNTIEQDVNLWSSMAMTRNALNRFSNSWDALGSGAEKQLQRLYIEDNPHPVGEKHNLLSAGDGSQYSYDHNSFHPSFTALQQERGYYDVFLLDADGDLVYSVFKEADFATNFETGQFASTGLGEVFRAARNGQAGEISFTDFAPYAPSQGAPASFIGKKVLGEGGEFLGVIAFQMPIDTLSALVGDLGDGIHAMIIGSDGLLRNEDPRFGADTFLKENVSGSAIAAALSGSASTMTDMRDGNQYLQAAAPLQFQGASWAFVAEVDEHLAFTPVQNMRNKLLLIVAGCLGVAVVASVFLARSISTPVVSLTSTISRLTDGELDAEVHYADRKDEIGAIAKSIDYFREKLKEVEAARADKSAAEAREREALAEQQRAEAEALAKEKEAEEQQRLDAEAKRASELVIAEEIANVVSACASGDFGQRLDMVGKDGIFAELCAGINQIAETTETNINDVVNCIGELSKGNLGVRIDGERQGAFLQMKDDFNAALATLSQTMAQIKQSGLSVSSTSSELEQSSLNMAKRAEDNAAAVEETSAAVEQIAASIRQVAANSKAADEATRRVRESADKNREISEETEASINAMTEASALINRVVKVIEDIAFQINLLALNAGVEAARAGEAGRGFSVVASEVRALAQRSQDAVQEISTVIERNTQSVEAGVEKVGKSRRALEDIISEVEVASDQISDIAIAVDQQSMGVEEVNTAIRSIDSTSQTNAAALEEMTASSVSLNEEAKALGEALSHFHVVSDKKAGVRDSEIIPFDRKPAVDAITLPKKKASAGGGSSLDDSREEF